MKAIAYTKLDAPNALKVMEVPMPALKSGKILIRAKASAITNVDYIRFTERIKSGKTPFSIRVIDTLLLPSKPKILGAEISGVVEAVGKNVKGLKVGDEVFGITPMFSRGWAEYVVVDEKAVFQKPVNLSFEQAAALPIAGITAFSAICKARVSKGQRVLVYGASGGVGHMTLLLAKALGANVTAVCSTRNMDMCRGLGADYCIDYKKEDVFKAGQLFDVIIACNGSNPLEKYEKLLNKGGIFVVLGGSMRQLMGAVLGPLLSIRSGKKLTVATQATVNKKEALTYLKETFETSDIVPYLDKIYRPQEIAEALQYIVELHPQGKVGVSLDFSGTN